jgi:hypothetical protein
MGENRYLWQNLSSFWDYFSNEDKQYIEKNWDGVKDAIDDLYYQSAEINGGNGLNSCPIFTTRRWCLLDLTEGNLDSVNKAGDDFVKKNKVNVQSNVDIENNIYNNVRSVLHKHFCFIWLYDRFPMANRLYQP